MDMRNTSSRSIPYYATAYTMAQYLDLTLMRQMQAHYERGPSPHYKPNFLTKTRATASNRRLSLVGTAQKKCPGHLQRPHQKHHQHIQVCTNLCNKSTPNTVSLSLQPKKRKTT
eukprot:1139682-Pelagomonas_calceolata.AAC.1